MMIDQRNAGASVTPTNGAYTVDRWQFQVSQASKITVQQNAGSVTPPAGFKTYLGVTVGASANVTVAAGDYFILNQYIEGFNFADMGFGAAGASTVTLSFWVRSSLTGTFAGSLFNNAFNRSYPFTYTISAANTWEQKSVTIAGDTTGTWIGASNVSGVGVTFSLGAGSTYSGTAGAWTGSGLFSATGATSVVGTNTATFYITGVQLEKGSTATPFEQRLYTTELQLCQRYLPYFGGVSSQNQSFGQCYSNTTTELRCVINFPVPARSTPTGLVASTASGFIGQMIASVNLTASAVTWASIASPTSQLVIFTVSGATANQSGSIYNASAGYIYFTGCEL
jgi:hypothetical protein